MGSHLAVQAGICLGGADGLRDLDRNISPPRREVGASDTVPGAVGASNLPVAEP